ncbi:MAG: hypothetical protein IAE96_06725 [Chitinophagaceae bacterium]|nr:hypothetical protein [Chitinophagaceae bacterium]
MKYIFFAFLLAATGSFAQPANYDIASFVLPKGWKPGGENNSSVQYQKISGNDWGQIVIYKNTLTAGSPEADFDSEWQKLAASVYNIQEAPQKTAVESAAGEWKKISGSANWSFNGKNVTTTFITFSGYNACISLVYNRTDAQFDQAFQQMLSSLTLQTGSSKPDPAEQPAETKETGKPAVKTTVSSGYKFTSTKFDDGWTSSIQEDWVEVEKGRIRVLIHYPREGTIFPADPDVLSRAAWNILVAPRYSHLSNFKTSYVQDYNRPYFATGSLTENSSGKPVFVVLFRRSGGWIEVVSPDKATFTTEFGFDPESIHHGYISEFFASWLVVNSAGQKVQADAVIFDKLDRMVNYNKFAVAAADLDNTGKWNSGFSSNTFYTNYYTGASAGMSTYSSSVWFEFKAGQQYHWGVVMANSYGGTTSAVQAKSDGTFKSLNDWQLRFSDIEGKPKTYDAYFSAIKGGRVLWMNDAEYPGSGIYTGYSR